MSKAARLPASIPNAYAKVDTYAEADLHARGYADMQANACMPCRGAVADTAALPNGNPLSHGNPMADTAAVAKAAPETKGQGSIMPKISPWQEERDTEALAEFMRAEGERIRAQLRRARQPWRERLTEQELQLVQFAQVYTQHFGDRLAEWPDGRRVALMAKLASLLDEKELVVVTYGDGPE